MKHSENVKEFATRNVGKDITFMSYQTSQPEKGKVKGYFGNCVLLELESRKIGWYLTKEMLRDYRGVVLEELGYSKTYWHAPLSHIEFTRLSDVPIGTRVDVTCWYRGRDDIEINNAKVVGRNGEVTTLETDNNSIFFALETYVTYLNIIE